MTRSPRVALFVTCLVDLHRPSVGFASISLLEAAGCSVEVPRTQTCCGQPHFNSGYHSEARALAKHTIQAFANGQTVVTPSGSDTTRTRRSSGAKPAGAWHSRNCSSFRPRLR